MIDAEHFVQFYENDTFLTNRVSSFINAGLQTGEAGVVIATKPHCVELNLRGVGSGGRRLMVLDAADTLAKFMIDGRPHEKRFKDLIGGLIGQASRHGNGRARVFGEMVTLLWSEGKREAAIRLEELWNELATVHSFSLFCAYPMKVFSSEDDGVSFLEVCSAHSQVWPAESYTGTTDPGQLNLIIAQLQQKTSALETEVAKRKEVENALRSREKELSDFLENGVEGLHMVGPAGRIVWANKAQLKLLGYRPDEYIGHHIAEFHVDREAIEDILKKLLSGETVYDYPARLRCKDNSIKDVLVHSNALWEDGKFIHTRCFTRDITERKRIEEQLRVLTADLDRRVAERTHELVLSQSKLRALASELSLAEQRVRRQLATELHDYLAQLLVVVRIKLNQASRAADSKLAVLLKDADQVLDESILYTRSLMADLCPPVLQFGLPMGLKWLAEKLRRHNLAVKIEMNCSSVELPEDQTVLLFQSVRELLFNVVKHGETDCAKISLQTNGKGELRIEVSDKGRGFDPATLTAGDKACAVVSQFGLFSIRERMDAMGGRLEIHSRRGHGTRAALVLPYGRRDMGMTLAPRIATPALAEHRDGEQTKTVHLLLVDDHAMVREGLRGILESYEDIHVVGEAADGQEAIELARILAPDVVVMDVNLPKLDGVEATRQIKKERPSTVVIGLSVHQASEIEHVLKDAGATSYVTKDSAGERLHQAIIKAVRGGTG